MVLNNKLKIMYSILISKEDEKIRVKCLLLGLEFTALDVVHVIN